MKLFELQNSIVYHGTSSTKSDKILKSGFDMSKIGSKSGTKLSGVSLTVDKQIAEEHAEWAVEEFGGDPVILAVDLSSLKIMPGKKITALWNEHGSLDGALRIARKTFDGAELFDKEEESGLEEFEVLVFDPKKLRGIHEI